MLKRKHGGHVLNESYSPEKSERLKRANSKKDYGITLFVLGVVLVLLIHVCIGFVYLAANTNTDAAEGETGYSAGSQGVAFSQLYEGTARSENRLICIYILPYSLLAQKWRNDYLPTNPHRSSTGNALAKTELRILEGLKETGLIKSSEEAVQQPGGFLRAPYSHRHRVQQGGAKRRIPRIIHQVCLPPLPT